MSRLPALATRLAFFAAVWWTLTEGRAGYWGYGAVAVVLVTAASPWLVPLGTGRTPLVRRVVATVRLISWFAVRAVAGGADIALRALRAHVDVDPCVVRVPVTLPPGPARELALGLVGLMPGTLVQAAGDDEAEIHALSSDLAVHEQWDELQRRVAAAAGLSPG